MNQRRYTEEERARLVAGWVESVESRAAYARRHGVSALSLARWEKERRGQAARPGAMSFVEVEVPARTVIGPKEERGREVLVAEVEIPGGGRVRFYRREGAC